MGVLDHDPLVVLSVLPCVVVPLAAGSAVWTGAPTADAGVVEVVVGELAVVVVVVVGVVLASGRVVVAAVVVDGGVVVPVEPTVVPVDAADAEASAPPT